MNTDHERMISREIMTLYSFKLNRIHIHQINPRRHARIKRLRDRIKLKELIAERSTPEGVIHVEESGMDCDGVRYSGSMTTIQANIEALDDLYDERGESADGPFYLSVCTAEQAAEITYQSRDLGMEAYEDGHPHILYG